ncbi:MAG: AraC family transcriptional regulator [Bacteroidales bacterium]|nr:AraC family transcriptional regulator [Bacteroidales bacterium]
MTSDRKIRRVLKKYVERKGYLQPSTVKNTLATETGLDSKALHDYFLRETGASAEAWRTTLRVEEAKRLLIEEPQAILRDIARRCGFSDRSNFSKQFLSATGLTPAEWRESAPF